MPVSPQDFALWSRMTGNPYPQTPAERMALAPEVYSYTRQVGRQGGPTMGPVRRAVDIAGKAALAAGAIAGVGYLASKGFGNLDLDDEPEIVPTIVEEIPNPDSQTARTSGDITDPTTAENYNQNKVYNQTGYAHLLRGTTPDKPTRGPIEEKSTNQSQVISSQQHFAPGTETEQLASSAQPSPTVREQAENLINSVTGGIQAEREEARGMSRVELLGRRERLAARQRARGQFGLEALEPSPASWEGELADPSHLQEMMSQQGTIQIPQTTTVVPGPVSPTPKTRVVTTTVEEESPIAAMATVTAPETAAPRRMTPELMEDDRLARKALSHLPYEQAMGLLASARAAKGSKTMGTPSESMTVVAEPRTTTRVVVPGTVNPPGTTISPNKFLSEMSQQVGPVATYKVSAERSPAVKGLSFYPGGEVGVQMRRGGTGEFAYATADPYRLALSEYAEEGFPSGMGKIGGIVSKAGTAAQLGLQKAVEPGGVISENQPPYAGLMDAREIAKKLASKSQRTREQAAYHADTRDIMQTLEERAAQRRAGLL